MLDKMFGASSKHGVLGSRPKRSYDYVLKKCMEELGELSVEVQIEQGMSYKDAGIDGIRGEAVDLAIAAMDMFALTCGNMSKNEMKELFSEIISSKIDKWHKKSGVASDRYTEVLSSGVRHSFDAVDKSYSDRCAIWFRAENAYCKEYENSAIYEVESYTLEDYMSGKRDTFIHVADYDDAVETFNTWQTAFNDNINLSQFTHLDETFYLILRREGNKGVILSQLDPIKLLGSKRVFKFSRGVGLRTLLPAYAARDQKLRGVKQWDDYQSDFYYEMEQHLNGWRNDAEVLKLTPDFKPNTEELYTICVAITGLPHYESFEEGEMFIEMVDRYDYCNQTKNNVRGYYYEIKMEFEVGNSYKQYNLEIYNGKFVLTTYGKIDTEVLTSQKRSFGTDLEALKYINSKTAEKLREGYTIVGSRAVK